MPLRKQVIDVNLAVGMSTIRDEKVQGPGSNALVENGRFTKDGIIRKMPKLKPNASVGAAFPVRIDDVFTHNGEVYVDAIADFFGAGPTAYAGPVTGRYDKPTDSIEVDRLLKNWSPLAAVSVEVMAGQGMNIARERPSRAEWGGYVIESYQNARLKAYVKITRLSDGVVVYSSSVAAYKSVCYAPGADDAAKTQLAFTYMVLSSSTTGTIIFDTADETVVTAANLTPVATFSAFFDIAGLGIYWFEQNGGSYDLRYAEYDTDATILVASTVVVAGLPIPKSTFTATRSHSKKYLLCWQDTVTSYPQYMEATGATVDVAVLPVGTNTANMVEMVAQQMAPGGAFTQVVVQYNGTGNPPAHLEHFTVHPGGSITTLTAWYHAAIAAKPFVVDGVGYLVIASTGAAQQTTFVMGIAGYVGTANVDQWSIFSQFLTRRRAGGPSAFVADSVVSATQGATSKVNIGCYRQMRLVSDGEIIEQAAIAEVIARGSGKQRRYVGGQLICGGAYTSFFNRGYYPVGASQFPEIAQLTASPGGSLSAGVYSYKLMCEGTDGDGNIYRSAASPAVLATVALNDRVSVLMYPSFAWTENQLDDVVYRVYRTAVGGSVHYDTGLKLSGGSVLGGPETLQYDGLSDTGLTDNTVFYTEGGELENQAPPPMSILDSAGGRIWGWAADDRSVVVASKQKEPNVGLGFNDALTMTVEDGGPGTGIASMDANMILFKRSMVLAMPASGPNKLGQGAFPSPSEISRSIGCTSPNSVLRVPGGVMFQSERGIQLLGRDLQISYVGADVEDYNDFLVESSLYDATRSEALFLGSRYPTTNDCIMLVYNTLFGRWSVNKLGDQISTVPELVVPVAQRLAILGGNLYTLAGGARTSEALLFIDSGAFSQPLTVTTPWYNFASVSALKRLTRAVFLGEYASAHTLNIEVYTDWDESAPVQTMSFDATTGYTAGELLTFSGHLSRQKARAFRFRIYDSDLNTGTKEGYRPSVLSLQVGAKKGAGKLPAGLRI